MKDSTAAEVYQLLLAHSRGCDQCLEACVAVANEQVTDGQAVALFCLAGRPMVFQFLRKKMREMA